MSKYHVQNYNVDKGAHGRRLKKDYGSSSVINREFNELTGKKKRHRAKKIMEKEQKKLNRKQRRAVQRNAEGLMKGGMNPYLAVFFFFLTLGAIAGGAGIMDDGNSPLEMAAAAPLDPYSQLMGNQTAPMNNSTGPAYGGSATGNMSEPVVEPVPMLKKMLDDAYAAAEADDFDDDNVSKEKARHNYTPAQKVHKKAPRPDNPAFKEHSKEFKEAPTHHYRTTKASDLEERVLADGPGEVEVHSAHVESRPMTRSGGDGTADYEIVNVSNDPENADENPVLYEDSLIWIKEQGGNFDLMYKNLTTGEEKVLENDGHSVIEQADIWDKNVVFIKNDDEGDNNIFLVDKESGDVQQLTNYDHHKINSLKIHENKVVYLVRDSHTNEKSIALKDILSDDVNIIITSDTAKTPDVYDNNVIYEDEIEGKDVIKVYNTITKETKNLHDTSLQQKNPRISSDKVAFYGSYDGSKWDVFVKDLKTGDLKQITDNGDQPRDSELDINGDSLAWREKESGIHIYDLSDDSTYNDNLGLSPTIFGKRFAYIGGGTGDNEIMLATEKTTTPEPNDSPVFKQDIPDGEAGWGEGWSYTFDVTDPEGDPVTVSIDGEAFEIVGKEVKLKDTYKTNVGDHEGKLTATDTHGNSVTDYFTIEVLEKGIEANNNPVLEDILGGTVEKGEGWSVILKAYDPDGDSLTYSLEENVSYELIEEGNIVKLRLMEGLEDEPGMYPCFVTVEDGKGGSDSDSFSVIVNNTADPDGTIDNDTIIYPPVDRPDGMTNWQKAKMLLLGAGIVGLGSLLGYLGRRRKAKEEKKKKKGKK